MTSCWKPALNKEMRNRAVGNNSKEERRELILTLRV